LLWWDLWRWSDLASGRVHKRHPHTLYDPERSWRQRKLRLGYMAASDIREVVSIVNRHYRLPPPPEVPERLTVKYGFRHSVTFDAQGIQALGGGEAKAYTWNEVRRVRVTRMDPVRRDFWMLVIVLPDQEIILPRDSLWNSTPEEINETLVRHVSPDRIDTYIAGERLTKRQDIERELELATKKARWASAVLVACMLTILIGALVIAMGGANVLGAMRMGGLPIIAFTPVFLLMWRAERKRIDELNRWLRAAIEAE